jgi:PleD family two-component response regulator
MGICSLIPQPNTEARRLIDAVEQSLKQAKDQGRNCIIIYP